VNRIAAIVTLTAFAAPCAWALIYLLPPLNGDVSAILYFADRMLSGDRLYVDIVDVNPPLIFWLSAVPAWLARQLGLGPAPVFVAMVLALHAVSFGLCRDAFRRLAEFRRPFAATFVPLVLLLALLVLPGRDFGQRCHLMIVLALPYATVAALRLQGDAPSPIVALCAGALAAVGFLIKPYYLLIPLAVELALLARLGWTAAIQRAEPWLIALGGGLYATAALAWCPSYFTTVLPLIEKYYLTPSLHNALTVVFGVEDRWLGLLAVLPALAIALVSPHRPALRIAVLVTLTGALIAALQGKGWPYHLLPFWTGAIMTGAIVVAALAEVAAGGCRAAALRLGAVGAFAALAGAVVVEKTTLGDRLDYGDSLAGRLQIRLARLAADRPVLWLTDAIYPHYPVVLYDHARPAIAPMELWLLGSVYGRGAASSAGTVMRAPAQMSADERAVFEQVGTALERTRPALVLIASAAAELQLPAGSFDYLAYFLRHPSFAHEWPHYREVAEIDGTRVYQRVDVRAALADP
jgi:hypothetical protein